MSPGPSYLADEGLVADVDAEEGRGPGFSPSSLNHMAPPSPAPFSLNCGLCTGRLAATYGAISRNTSIANSAEVDFGAAAGSETVSHFAIFDAASGGNMLGSNALASSQTVVAGNLVKFAVGALTITVG